MSAPLVLRDAAIERGLGLCPTRDLTLWASAAPGELGALGREVLASRAAPSPVPVHIWVHPPTSATLSSRGLWFCPFSKARSSRHVSDVGSKSYSRTRAGSWNCAWSATHSGTSARATPWSEFDVAGAP